MNFIIFLYEKKRIKWEKEMKLHEKYGKGNSRATIAERKTRANQLNTRRTIEEAFDLVTPANQSLGRLIPHSSRFSRPSVADQTIPDSGKLSKRPFRKNSICTQMKATNYPAHVPVSFLPYNSTLRSRPNVACHSVSLGQRTRVVAATNEQPCPHQIDASTR